MVKTADQLPDSPEESIPPYGLGLMHFKDSPLGGSYGHEGGGPGYTTFVTHFPYLKGSSVSISLVLNKSIQGSFSLVDDIITHYIESQN